MTSSEQLMRLLRTTSDHWAEIYRARTKRFGDVPETVIFPDQIVAQRSPSFYSVSFDGGGLGISMNIWHHSKLEARHGFQPARRVETVEQWIEMEESNVHELRCLRDRTSLKFDEQLPLFLTRDAAKNWAIKQLQNL